MTATGTEARVCQDIAHRQAKGIAKYGTTVEQNPLGMVQWIRHAYEECLDQAVYLRRCLEVLEGAKSTTLEDGSVLTASPPPATEKPWVPDDSGEWVEVPNDFVVCPVGPRERVMTLSRREREVKEWSGQSVAYACDWYWPAIVAYKVVK